jgi:hypothetical protein
MAPVYCIELHYPQITPVESHFQWCRKATFSGAGADCTDLKEGIDELSGIKALQIFNVFADADVF